ncbi:MAG: metal ABC transporter ATP-binding protein [Actinomycetes bacterium]
MSRTPALELQHVAVAYDRLIVLEGVTGTVAPGESVALIGPNGSGKSTLLKAILGLVPLQAGTLSVLGQTPQRARRSVAYVPQQDTLDPEFPVTVQQVVLMGRYRRIGWIRRPRQADRDAATAALAQVGLADQANARFGTLSGGQRQRVLIARAIAQESRLLLLDEPFNGVDSATQVLLLQVLADLRASGVAIVMSTHDLSVAHIACGDACVLNRRQVAFGPVDDVLTAEHLREAYGPNALAIVSSNPGQTDV